jgi:hypothetical protein
MLLRLREGERGGSNGAIEVPGETGKGMSTLNVGKVEIVPDSQAAIVRISNLGVGVTVPSGLLKSGEPRMYNTAISTNIDVREGQKVVVGKANMAGAPDQALILVLTAKVLD